MKKKYEKNGSQLNLMATYDEYFFVSILKSKRFNEASVSWSFVTMQMTWDFSKIKITKGKYFS